MPLAAWPILSHVDHHLTVFSSAFSFLSESLATNALSNFSSTLTASCYESAEVSACRGSEFGVLLPFHHNAILILYHRFIDILLYE